MPTTPPHLVVLDGYTLNPGDLSWERLLSLGNCSIYERTAADAVVAEAAEAQLVLTNKIVLSRSIIEALPLLKYIGVMATGYNVVDLPDYAQAVDLDTLFSESDVVSLHCPLTTETKGLVNAARLRMMKPSALLINTSRGPLIDERALADALQRGTIAGAGLDVLSSEPPPEDHPLLGIKNCTITPHIAWATRDARNRLLETVVDNVAAFLAGHPQNVVN